MLVTGAAESSAQFVRLLEAQGASVTAAPFIHIGPPPDERALQDAVDRAGRYGWLVFTSAAGVEAFARRLRRKLDPHVRIAAVGPSTRRCVAERLSANVDVEPERFTASELADAIARSATVGETMLVLAAREASPILLAKLRAAGFAAEKVDAYTTVEAAPADCAAQVAANDVVTLASPSAVRALVRGLGENAVASALRGKLLACIGPVTLMEARERGLHVEIVADSSTLASVVEALCRYYTTH